MNRLVVISPHLDDAVWSCGTLIAAARLAAPVIVVTVCAGIPAENVLPGSLDSKAGFESAAEAVRARRAEDAAALDLLGADLLHLDVLDDQYARHGLKLGSARRLAEYEVQRRAHFRHLLAPVLALAGIIVAPVGIRHPDHKAVAAACRGGATWLYEELPYRVAWPDFVPGLPDPILELEPNAVKARAVRLYASQLQGEPGPELSASERYHAGPGPVSVAHRLARRLEW